MLVRLFNNSTNLMFFGDMQFVLPGLGSASTGVPTLKPNQGYNFNFAGNASSISVWLTVTNGTTTLKLSAFPLLNNSTVYTLFGTIYSPLITITPYLQLR